MYFSNTVMKQACSSSLNMLSVQTSWYVGLHKPKPLSTFCNCYCVRISSPYSQKNLLTVLSQRNPMPSCLFPIIQLLLYCGSPLTCLPPKGSLREDLQTPSLSFHDARLGYRYVALGAPFLLHEFVQFRVLYKRPLKSSGKSERKMLNKSSFVIEFFSCNRTLTLWK